MSARIGINARLLKQGSLDGIGRFTYEVFRRVIAQTPEYHFILYYDNKSEALVFDFPNCEARYLSPPTKHVYLFDFYFNKVLARRAKADQLDLLVSPDGILCKGLDIPQLPVIHDLNFEHHPEWLANHVAKYFRKRFQGFAEMAQLIATVSEYSRQDIADTYNIPESNIHVVYNAGGEQFQPLTETEQEATKERFSNGKPYLLFVGTIHPRKNIEGVIRTFEIYRNRSETDMQLLIAGKEVLWSEEMKNALDQCAYKDDIRILGMVNDTDLVNLTASTSAMVYLSHFEGFGIPIVEAMQSGVPVVVSDATVLPEVVGNQGIVVPHGDYEATANKLIELEDQTYCNTLIEQGLQRAKKFNWGESAVTMKRIIQQCLDARP